MGIKHRKASRAARELAAMDAEARRRARLTEEIERLTAALAEARETIDQKDRELVEKDRELSELRASLAKPRGPETAPATWSRDE